MASARGSPPSPASQLFSSAVRCTLMRSAWQDVPSVFLRCSCCFSCDQFSHATRAIPTRLTMPVPSRDSFRLARIVARFWREGEAISRIDPSSPGDLQNGSARTSSEGPMDDHTRGGSQYIFYTNLKTSYNTMGCDRFWLYAACLSMAGPAGRCRHRRPTISVDARFRGIIRARLFAVKTSLRAGKRCSAHHRGDFPCRERAFRGRSQGFP